MSLGKLIKYKWMCREIVEKHKLRLKNYLLQKHTLL